MKISDLLPLLQRFPQEAYLVVCGERGFDDLRIWAPTGEVYPPDSPTAMPKIGGEPVWEHYHIDAPDSELPWLTSPGDRLFERIRALRAAGMEFEEAIKTAKGEQP